MGAREIRKERRRRHPTSRPRSTVKSRFGISAYIRDNAHSRRQPTVIELKASVDFWRLRLELIKFVINYAVSESFARWRMQFAHIYARIIGTCKLSAEECDNSRRFAFVETERRRVCVCAGKLAKLEVFSVGKV